MPPKYPVIVPGVGPLPAPGMIVGEAPGRTEIERQTPFCGRSGTLLDETLMVYGAERGDFFITNAYKGDVGSGNPNPTADQIEDHSHLLSFELIECQPKGILLLGRVAISIFVADLGRVGDAVGRDRAWGTAKLFPCWHPAYVLRQRGQTAVEFTETIGRFVEYTKGRSVPALL